MSIHLWWASRLLTATFCCFYYIPDCAGCQCPDSLWNPVLVAKSDKLWYSILVAKGSPGGWLATPLWKGGGACGFDDLNHNFFDFGSAQRADQIHKKVSNHHSAKWWLLVGLLKSDFSKTHNEGPAVFDGNLLLLLLYTGLCRMSISG